MGLEWENHITLELNGTWGIISTIPPFLGPKKKREIEWQRERNRERQRKIELKQKKRKKFLDKVILLYP